MAELPAGLSCLTALTYVVVAQNKLQALPSFAALARLAVLEISGNLLQDLPPSVNLLPLQALCMCHNISIVGWPWGACECACKCMCLHVLS